MVTWSIQLGPEVLSEFGETSWLHHRTTGRECKAKTTTKEEENTSHHKPSPRLNIFIRVLFIGLFSFHKMGKFCTDLYLELNRDIYVIVIDARI